MKLVIARHAEAEAGAVDADRQLTDQGRADALQMSQVLKSTGWKFADVRSSPVLRARQTVDILAGTLAKQSVTDPRLRPGFDVLSAPDLLSGTPVTDACLWVFHAPEVTQLASSLLGFPEKSFYFPPGTILALNVSPPFAPSTAMLIWMLQPEYVRSLRVAQ
ncbi:MAG: histidine phosphatase family protein [Spirochaetia bacterium]|nr:histidine phosphatase family protein [Spirochaetia bacterium]